MKNNHTPIIKVERRLIMNYFFVDFENVQDSGFEGIIENFHDLKDIKNEILIFYSDHSPKIGIDLLANGLCELNIKFIKGTNLRKNGLDFNIVYKIGQMAEKIRIMKSIEKDDPECNFYILSKDRGYESILDQFKKDYPEYRLKIAASLKTALTNDMEIIIDNSSNSATEHQEKELEKKQEIKPEKTSTVQNNVTVNLVKSKSKSVNAFRTKTLKKIKETNLLGKDAIVKILNTSIDGGDFHNKLFNEYGEKGREIYREVKKQIV